MNKIKILSDRKTSSHILSGETITDIVQYLESYPRIFVLYDISVKGYADKLIHKINDINGTTGNQKTVDSFAMIAEEEKKNMQSVMQVCSWLLEKNADRYALLLGIGGGITTDITGFAASIYKRGLRFAFVPTTILSQVDAAIGGKNGVNFMNYKNMLGTIRMPEFVFECSEVLETLSYRDFVSGSAEMLKTFIIDNRDYNYEKAVRIFSLIHSSKDKDSSIKSYKKELLTLIHAAADIKADIVSRDKYEKGERRKLNLGHTFAHAIEWQASLTNKQTGGSNNISHGEAVAIGISIAADLSQQIGICKDKELARNIQNDFVSCGLATASPFQPASLADAMKKDKKTEDGMVHFILIESIGKVVEKNLEVEKVLNIIEKDK